MWDALMIEPGDWPRKHEVLVGHCEDVGRDPNEITCSAHVPWSVDAEPGALADRAARLFEAGVDVAVFSMRAPYSVAMVEPMVQALSELV